MSLAARSRLGDRECPQGAPGVQQEEQAMNEMARRMFELVEPIGVIPYSADEPNEAMFALGFTDYWDTYFAGRAAPLGIVPAEVVDACFYNFAPGEVARHIPKVWSTTTRPSSRARRSCCWSRRPARPTRGGRCTPRCARSRSPTRRWRGASTP